MSVLRARERDPGGAVAGKYTLAIEDLLDRYFEAEVFDGDNKWACEECGGKVALGVYFLSEGLSVYGSPVWTHEKNQLHLAEVDGGWSVQKDPSVGKNDCGLLRLCDAALNSRP